MTNQTPDNLELEDRFILLSAYLDQELTYAEKQQVEEWLSHDLQFSQLYRQQLRLRAGLRQAPVPQTHANPEQLVTQVIHQSHQRSQSKLFVLAGTTTFALLSIMAGIFTFGSHDRSLEFSTANQTMPAKQESESLMIALEKPIVPLPKALSNTNSSFQSK